MSNARYANASIADVCRWLINGVFHVEQEDEITRVFKGERELTQRENLRKRCDHGDPRVDLFYEGRRRSINVSSLVWMAHTHVPVPEGFEIHHRDEDAFHNWFENLICVHSLDHSKLHGPTYFEDEGTPF